MVIVDNEEMWNKILQLYINNEWCPNKEIINIAFEMTIDDYELKIGFD